MARKSKLTTDFTAKAQTIDEQIAALLEQKREEQERLDRARREQDGELMRLAGLNELPPDVKLGLCLDAARKSKSTQQVEAWRRLGAEFHDNAKRARAAKRHGEHGQEVASGMAGGEQGGGEAGASDVSQAA